MNTCRVTKCRFKHSHVASAHKCSRCGQYGHGMLECGNQVQMDRLKYLSRNDKLNKIDYCDLLYCEYKWSHKRSAHHCRNCGERSHCVADCPRLHIENDSDFFPVDDEGSKHRAYYIMGNEEGKIYVSILAGMGCSFWYRRNSRYEPLEQLFMHNDDWGQYGPGKVSQHASFIHGYRLIS